MFQVLRVAPFTVSGINRMQILPAQSAGLCLASEIYPMPMPEVRPETVSPIDRMSHLVMSQVIKEGALPLSGINHPLLHGQSTETFGLNEMNHRPIPAVRRGPVSPIDRIDHLVKEGGFQLSGLNHLPLPQGQSGGTFGLNEMNHLPIPEVRRGAVSPPGRMNHIPIPQVRAGAGFALGRMNHIPIPQFRSEELCLANEINHITITAVLREALLPPLGINRVPVRQVRSHPIPLPDGMNPSRTV
jgi:hypothetical protein